MLRFCVLGGGIKYTLSPIIHQNVFNALGVAADYAVEDMPPAELAAAVPRLRETYDGFNVTKPHKAAIIPYLTEKLTPLDAVNTVRRDGREWTGHNTDLGGFTADLTAFAGDVRGRETLVLGAGGAAEAVVCGLTAAGARVTVVNRTYAKAQTLAAKFGAAAAETARGLRPELIVNCTSVGGCGESALPPEVDTSALVCAYDLVYSPARTAFMAACESAGARASNGLGMLIRQAILADGIFLGRELDTDALYTELVKTLQRELS